MYKITADTETLMRQAPMTASTYLDNAVEDLDNRFGKGYAKANPELLGAYIKTCAIDFATAMIVSVLQDAGSEISSLRD